MPLPTHLYPIIIRLIEKRLFPLLPDLRARLTIYPHSVCLLGGSSGTIQTNMRAYPYIWLFIVVISQGFR